MKQILVELFVLLLTILLFLFGMNQFHQPANPGRRSQAIFKLMYIQESILTVYSLILTI